MKTLTIRINLPMPFLAAEAPAELSAHTRDEADLSQCHHLSYLS